VPVKKIAMKTLFIFLCLLVVSPKFLNSQISEKSTRLRNQLTNIQKEIIAAQKGVDLDAVMKFYDPKAICMPEYQPLLNGIEQIRLYYKEILLRRKITRFNKDITEIIDMGNTLAEIGLFSITQIDSTTKWKQQRELNGKYINIWKIQKDGSLLLQGEAFGYLHPVNNPLFYMVKTDANKAQNNLLNELNKSGNYYFEVKALNALQEEAVRNRDGNLRADFFTQDAIFMPYADSIKKGITAIRKHLIEYNRGKVVIDSIDIASEYIEALDKFIIEYPKFFVRRHTPDLSGINAGKGIRIWRRENDCTLKLYREIGIHDHIQ
jgi:ketosteroid isomerase-like protein